MVTRTKKRASSERAVAAEQLHYKNQETIEQWIKKAIAIGGRWVMIRVQLPLIEGGAPPPLSLHWAVPWPMDKKYCENYFRHYCRDENFDADEDEFDMDFALGLFNGLDRNPFRALKIKYKGNDVRLFADEVSFVSSENMKLYLEDGSHTLVPSSVAEGQIIQEVLDGEKKQFYDAALLDGANENQAFLTALGIPVEDDGAIYPAIGWYECRKEYVQHFFDVE
jgi:hypothetical protein